MKHKKTAILGLSLAAALLVAVLLIVSSCLLSPRQTLRAVLPPYDTMNSLQQMAREKHHHGQRRFINPFQTEKRDFCDLLRWKLASPNKFRDQLKNQEKIPVRVDWRAVQNHKGLSITFVKHAWVLIKDKDRVFMVDPILGKPVAFVKDFSPLGFGPEQIPTPDAVLITHGHFDHFQRAHPFPVRRDIGLHHSFGVRGPGGGPGPGPGPSHGPGLV